MKQNQNAHRAFTPGTATDEPVPSVNPESGRRAAAAGALPDPPDPPDPGAVPVAEPQAAPADPRFATLRAEEIYWAGVSHGIRSAGREPGHPHMPADFNLNLTRSSGNPSLVSSKLVEAWPYAPDEHTLGLGGIHGDGESEALGEGGDERRPSLEPGSPEGHAVEDPAHAAGPRAIRHDGWTDAKVRLFLGTLAETGVVADACRAAKMSRDSAYAFRRRASGRGFALGWDAALLLSRSAIGDDVIGRARYGVVDKVYRNGELVAERHRYDNRLTMSVLARLDRQAEGLGENAPVVRAIAQEFDRFLDLLPQGVRGAEAFLEERFPPPLDTGEPARVEEPRTAWGYRPTPGTESALLARLGMYEDWGVGLPAEIESDDLDPDAMADWTEDQWQRAEASGFLAHMSMYEWPAAARNGEADGTDGMCKLRKLYLNHYPASPDAQPPAPVGQKEEEEDDFAGCSVWEKEEGWRTDFPPPEGFEGFESGEPGGDDYSRELTEGELEVIGEDEESIEAEQAERLAEQHAARKRFFFLVQQEAIGEPLVEDEPGACLPAREAD